ADAKGSLTAMAVTMVELSKQKIAGKVIFCAVCDEEKAGPSGTEALVKEGITGDFTIVGEPTNFEVITAHSGLFRFKVTMQGKSAHAAMPNMGENAIERLDEVKALIRKLNMVRNPNWTTDPTCTITMNEGGAAINIIPPIASASFDLRFQPGDSPEKIIEQLQAMVALVGQGSVETLASDPPCVFDPNSVVAKAALKVAGKNKTAGVPYGTDAVLIPPKNGVIVFGPGKTQYAHSDEEQIETANIIIAVRCYKEIVSRCLMETLAN
ncbi:M20/M25/M40 family metallo-hydrolase, partial [Candidatus Microgenomates bacterium]|nr:M20/M25/M40 family metallo-hydrolase [Candidatus Microgenomates bacterium]